MTQQMTSQRESTQKRQAAFYSKWPDLNPDKHGEIVNRYARIYRDANPSATFDQMVEDLGPMVMVAAKVVPGASQAAAPNGAGSNGKGRPPSPFKPAVGGPASPPKPPEVNEWAGLAGASEDDE
jgi:hypothetical protein